MFGMFDMNDMFDTFSTNDSVPVEVVLVEDGPRRLDIDMTEAIWQVRAHVGLSHRQVEQACDQLSVGGLDVLQAWQKRIERGGGYSGQMKVIR